MFISDDFANFGLQKSFVPKLPFFYTIDTCGNGYSQNIVTTSSFITLVKVNIRIQISLKKNEKKQN